MFPLAAIIFPKLAIISFSLLQFFLPGDYFVHSGDYILSCGDYFP